MKAFANSKLAFALLSVFLAALLFIMANTSSYNNGGTETSKATETYAYTLTNIPIDIKYDSEEYFISGYSYETEVYLTSINRLKLDSEVSSDTRSFKVVADLSGLEPGTHQVDLKVNNMPSGVTGTVSPQQISVTIGKKASKTVGVQSNIDESRIASDYEVRRTNVDVSEVQVTSSQAILEQVDHVVASLENEDLLTEDFSGRVTLQAVSADGTILPSAIQPAQAKLEVKLKKRSKSLPLKVNLVGDMNANLSDITYKLSQEKVTVTGTQEELDKLEELEVDLDISNITANTSKILDLSLDNVDIEPVSVIAELTVSKK